jgi:hypothetical protein
MFFRRAVKFVDTVSEPPNRTQEIRQNSGNTACTACFHDQIEPYRLPVARRSG